MGCPESARLVLFDKNAMNLVENNFYEVKKFVKLYDKRNVKKKKSWEREQARILSKNK